MARTIDIGTDQTYADWATFWTAVNDTLPNGPTAEGTPWIIEVHNDEGALIDETASMNIDDMAALSDATNTTTIRPASGNGTLGDPNDFRVGMAGGALALDGSKGAGFGTSSVINLWVDTSSGAAANSMFVEGLQLETTSALFQLRTMQVSVSPVNYKQMIVRCEGDTSGANVSGTAFNFDNLTGTAENILLQVAGGHAGETNPMRAIMSGFQNATIRNLHLVYEGGSGHSKTLALELANALASFKLDNFLILGFDTLSVDDADGDLDASYIYTDETSALPSWMTDSVKDLTATVEVENMTTDFRLKTGATSRDVGGTSPPTDDIFGTTRDANEDIGCFEFVVVGSTGTVVTVSPGFVVSASGLEVMSGPAAVVSPSFQMSLTGTHPVLGPVAMTSPSFQMALTAVETMAGPAAVISPSFQMALVGQVGGHIGAVAMISPVVQMSATGLETLSGPAAVVSPHVQVDAVGVETLSGAVDMVSPSFQMDATGSWSLDAVVAMVAPFVQMGLTGSVGFEAVVAMVAPAFTIAATGDGGVVIFSAPVDVTLPTDLVATSLGADVEVALPADSINVGTDSSVSV